MSYSGEYSIIRADELDVANDAVIGGKIISTGILEAAKDTNNTSYLGRSAIGYVGWNNYGGMAHIDHATTTGYAFIQSPSGNTLFNAPATQGLYFKIADSNKMTVFSDGSVGVNTASSAGYLMNVNGTGYIPAAWVNSSDDRIKYDETDIPSALETIMKLSPQIYDKISVIPKNSLGNWIPTDAEWAAGASNNFTHIKEAGFIAQTIQATVPELAYLVTGELMGMVEPEVGTGDDPLPPVLSETPLKMKYQDIFIYNVAATQELKQELDTQKAKVALLEERISALEDAVF